MFKNYALAAFITLCTYANLNAQAPAWQWAKSIGGTANDIGHSVATDPSGNIFVSGSYEGTIDFDPGPGVSNLSSLGILDGFLVKLDPLGNFLWAVSIGGSHTDVAYSVAADHLGNVVVTGRFGNNVDFDPGPGTTALTSAGYMDIYVAKYSATGSLMWALSMGGADDDQCLAIALDTSGNIYGTGYFQTTCDFNPGAASYPLIAAGNSDVFIFKLEAAGGFIWAKAFGGLYWDSGMAIDVDGASNVYTTGYYKGAVDMDPGLGVSQITTFGDNDAYVSKLDVDGNFIWAKPLGGTQSETGRSIYSDYDGNVYSSGNFRGSIDADPGPLNHMLFAIGDYDVFISKLDSSGNYGWSGSIGMSQIENNYSMAADNAGNIYISGYYTGAVDFNIGAGVSTLSSVGGNDAYISKYDSAGNFVWAKSIGGNQSDIAQAIAIDNTNHLVVTGSYMSTQLVFNSNTLMNTMTNGTTADIFIARLDSAFLSSTIEVNNADNIVIYPNPANNFVVVGNLPETADESTIIITDIAGKLVFNKTISSQNELLIDTRLISNGVYSLTIQSQSFLKTTRLVINK